MTAISSELVRQLREATGAGIMDCKRALQEADGDLEKAREVLRHKGLAQAKKLAGRSAGQGLVDAYIHAGGQLGVLIEVNCETDFVARTDQFAGLVHDLAIQVAVRNPTYVSRQEVAADFLENEQRIERERALAEGRPAAVVEKIVAGKVDKLLAELCLYEQDYVRDEGPRPRRVETMIQETAAQLGEKIEVARFSRFKVGERQPDAVGDEEGA